MQQYPIQALVDLIEETKMENMTVAEIGVFNGATSVAYLPIIKQNNGKAYLVDHFFGSNIPQGAHSKHSTSHDQLLTELTNNINSIDCMDCVKILDMNSDIAHFSIEDKSLDICFIDAGHTYSEVMKDIKNYLPKVKPGGILCGHDCEGFELVNTFTEDELESEWKITSIYPNGGCHPGTIQAVYDSFGNIELKSDSGGNGIPVWIYHVPENVPKNDESYSEIKKSEKLKLHLGCFHKKIHGYINVDIREEVNPDVIDDITKLNKFSDNSADEIYCCHVLEHTTRDDSKIVMKRWFDVLKPGGILKVSVPDLQAVFEHYVYHKDLDILQTLLYGAQKHPYDLHYMGWDETTLTRDLQNVGFKNVKRYDWRETEHFFIDDYSQAYLPNISYTTRRTTGTIQGRLMSLNIEAVK